MKLQIQSQDLKAPLDTPRIKMGKWDYLHHMHHQAHEVIVMCPLELGCKLK